MLRILVLLLVFPAMALAQDLPAPLTDSVSDFANLLSPDQEAALTTRLQSARAETGVHVVIATMGRIADYGSGSQSIEGYGKTLFNHWGIGDAARNDGILILVARDDREMRIALGAGFDPVYDGLAQRVIDRDMLPAFRRDDYAGGIAVGAEAVIRDLARPFAAHATPAPVKPDSDIGGIAVFGAAVAGFGLMMLRRKIGDLLTRLRACPHCGARGLHRHRNTLTAATTTQAGSGLQITRCSQCSYERQETFAIPARGSDKSGGSGFGGGRSSGGGASGRW